MQVCIFAPKLITFMHAQFAASDSHRYPKLTWVDRSILALLSPYQEYLVTFKLTISQVVQRTRPESRNICAIGSPKNGPKPQKCDPIEGKTQNLRLLWTTQVNFISVTLDTHTVYQ